MRHPAANRDALRRHVEVLAGEIGERNVQRPAALAAAESYIARTWAELGFQVADQRYVAAGVDCANLEVVVAGDIAPAEIVVVGAHYDTVPGSPGADDNASAVAALLEITRLAAHIRPQRTLKLVAFVNEEAPFFYWGSMGSGVYARAARRRGDDIRAMFSLEMLGCYSDAPGSQTYPPLLKYFYPDRGDFVAFVSNLRSRRVLREAVAAFRASSRFPCESAALPSWIPGVGWSDQLSFWRAGYHGVMVTDTAFHRYPHYHRPTDTPDRLDYARLAQVTEGLAGAFTRLAGSQ
jgi:Zn-dependent M28 family amino/carboxypeptidase